MTTFLRALVLLLTLSYSTSVEAVVGHVKSDQGFCGSATRGGNIATTCNGVTNKPFTFTATNTGDAILFLVSCASTGSPGTVTLTASGWTATQVGAITGSNTAGWAAAFKAYSPNTSAATFTVTWGATCGGFMNDLIDEFSGADGTDFVDNNGSATNTSGGCALSITPASANTGLWFACNDNVSGTGTYTKGADDTQSDWSEWKILVGGSGASQASAWTTSGAFVIFGVTVKEAGGGGGTPGCKNGLLLYGVGCEDLQTSDQVSDTGTSK